MTTGPGPPDAETTSPLRGQEKLSSELPVPFEGRITFEAYRRAQWLHLLRLLRRLLLLWAIMGVAFLANLLMTPPDDPGTTMVPILVFAAVVLGLWGLSEASIRRSWRNHKALREPIQGALFDDHFETRSRVGSSDLPWSHFHDSRASKDLLLLYQSNNCLHILSRDLFASDEDWRRARDLVTRIQRRRRRTS